MQHIRRVKLAVMLCLSLITISVFYPLMNMTNPTVVQAKQKQLLDQQVAILVGLYINPNWVKQQNAQNNLVYGIVRPADKVPDGVQDYSYLATTNDDDKIYLFFKTTGRRVIIKYANHGSKLHTKIVPLKKLIRHSYHTKQQRRQVNQYVSTLKTEP